MILSNYLFVFKTNFYVFDFIV